MKATKTFWQVTCVNLVHSSILSKLAAALVRHLWACLCKVRCKWINFSPTLISSTNARAPLGQTCVKQHTNLQTNIFQKGSKRAEAEKTQRCIKQEREKRMKEWAREREGEGKTYTKNIGKETETEKNIQIERVRDGQTKSQEIEREQKKRGHPTCLQAQVPLLRHDHPSYRPTQHLGAT